MNPKMWNDLKAEIREAIEAAKMGRILAPQAEPLRDIDVFRKLLERMEEMEEERSE